MLWLLLGTAFAADVLIPAASPLTPDDFSVADSLNRQVVAASLQAGLAVEDADGIRVWAGADSENCFDTDACPGNLWGRTDARVAVVMRVGKGSNGTLVEVRLFGADDTAPIKVMRETIQSGKEASFAAKLALSVQELVELLPARTAPKAATPITPVKPVDPVIEIRPLHPEENPTPTAPNPKPPDVVVIPPPPEAPPLTNHLHLPKVVFEALVASKEPEAQWLGEQRVRVGRLSLQIGTGLGLGDVDRGYRGRLLIKTNGGQTDELGRELWLGDGFGVGFNGWAAISYAPTWFLDTSLSVGVLYGNRYMDMYSACVSGCEGSNLPIGDSGYPESGYATDPKPQVEALIEPKIRVLPVVTGYVKPYLLTGATVRIYSGFEAFDYGGADFPDSAGGASVMPMVGAGTYVDALPNLSLFLEAPFSFILPGDGTRSSVYDEGILEDYPNALIPPEPMNHWGGILRLSLGVEVVL